MKRYQIGIGGVGIEAKNIVIQASRMSVAVKRGLDVLAANGHGRQWSNGQTLVIVVKHLEKVDTSSIKPRTS